jgi:PAS domain S-box-containing protein
MSSSDLVLASSYDYRLVALSILIAVAASHAALGLSARVTVARGWSQLAWMSGGATLTGFGTWSMHYCGMLAFHLPVPIQYDWPTSLISLFASIFSSVVAVFFVTRQIMGPTRVLVGSMFMGGGIVALHYIGMASMRLPAMCHYSPALVAVSVVLAIGASMISLWLMFLLRNTLGPTLKKAVSAVFMGAAICLMHYTAMAAASYTRSTVLPDLSHALSISILSIIGIAGVPLVLLETGTLTSLVDRLQKRTILLEELFEQTPQAIALVNPDQGIARVNRAFTRLFGYTPQEITGRRLKDLIVPAASRAEVSQHWDMVVRGQRVDTEGFRLRKDGSQVYVVVVLVPFSLPAEETQVYAIYQDITARKQAEDRLRDKSEQLRALSASLRSAKEEEGTRIAREIHDELGSLLAALKWDLEGVGKVVSEPTIPQQLLPLRGKVASMISLTDTTIKTVKKIASELRPSILDDLGLVEAIKWQAEQFQARTSIHCYCDVSIDHAGLDTERSTAVFRIFQEALTNILRHAQATSVAISLKEQNGELVLTVSDNGRGMTVDEKSDKLRLGILGMQERAHLFGGTVDISGVEGKGATVIVHMPLKNKEATRTV